MFSCPLLALHPVYEEDANVSSKDLERVSYRERLGAGSMAFMA